MNHDFSPDPIGESHVSVAVVGGGQAGLSMSHFLREQEIDHVVFEKHTLAHTWRTQRWDAFCLVTPNWQCQLPGHHYAGADPHGFMVKEQIVDYLDAFIAKVNAPVREGVAVLKATPRPDGGFTVETSAGRYVADQLVVASGGYHNPIVPRLAERLPPWIGQLHSAQYRNPAALPKGAVLVVGTGQSGAQIAEDLHLAGRKVYLATGDAPRCARLYRGKDVVDWLADMRYYEMAVDQHPLREGVRDNTNHYVTGREGGRDIDLRKFALEGMELFGRLSGLTSDLGRTLSNLSSHQSNDRAGDVDTAARNTEAGAPGPAARGHILHFDGNLAQSLDHADVIYNGINASIDRYIDTHGLSAPPASVYEPVWRPEAERLTLSLETTGIGSVIWCIGFAPDFRWVDAPVFNGRGEPVHERGVTRQEGLYFLGLPWLHTWGSGRFSGVARDAEHVATHIARLGQPLPQEA